MPALGLSHPGGWPRTAAPSPAAQPNIGGMWVHSHRTAFCPRGWGELPLLCHLGQESILCCAWLGERTGPTVQSLNQRRAGAGWQRHPEEGGLHVTGLQGGPWPGLQVALQPRAEMGSLYPAQYPSQGIQKGSVLCSCKRTLYLGDCLIDQIRQREGAVRLVLGQACQRANQTVRGGGACRMP